MGENQNRWSKANLNPTVKRNYEESARAIQQWGPAVARKYVIRINELYAVKDLTEAYNVQALKLHPLKGSKRGQLSIHLTDRWRLIVTEGETQEHVVVEEVNNHYDD